MGAWENEFQFSQNYISHMKFTEIYPCFHNVWEIWLSFLGLPGEIFFGVITDDWLHLYALKNVKKNAIFFKLFWYKVFVHWELKLLNFLVDCVLIFIVFTSFKRLLCQDVPIDQYTFDGV